MANKIGILTTHRANNFGAVLQAFALVNKCKDIGVDAEIMDWRHPYLETQYYDPWKVKCRNPIPKLSYAWRWYVRERKSRKLFEEFRSCLPLSRQLNSYEQLQAESHKYDGFIVGSDQIWNPQMTSYDGKNFDHAYLLDFCEKLECRKCAYAASIGHKGIEPIELVPEFALAWKNFDLITMREKAGANFVKATISRDIEVVCDPVLLLDAERWRREESETSTPSLKYVVVYNVQHYRPDSQWLVDMAMRYCSANGCKLVDVFVPSARVRWTRNSVSAGPREFIHLLDNAVAVFTNSFHASAFSLIFGKKLFLNVSQSKGTTNTRFDLFNRVSADRVVEIANNGKQDRIEFHDFANVDDTFLFSMKARSLSLLSKMVM